MTDASATPETIWSKQGPSLSLYEVRVKGYDGSHGVLAWSRSQARYFSWMAAAEAGYYTRAQGGLLAFARDATVRLARVEDVSRLPRVSRAYR